MRSPYRKGTSAPQAGTHRAVNREPKASAVSRAEGQRGEPRRSVAPVRLPGRSGPGVGSLRRRRGEKGRQTRRRPHREPVRPSRMEQVSP